MTNPEPPVGASSFVLAGEGNQEALSSACHGAGRALTRGQAAHVDDRVALRELRTLRVVTPVNPEAPALRGRRELLAKFHQRLKEEAPGAYKPITPIVESVEAAGIARRVARLWPIVTVKG